ncbi:energy-coupling factor transporter transmembrane component T family protein [Glutamicibacter endophyticus]|uniref:energy-coupling factor transporter transmembrane component T family protein n=1 Tax=Glutamicibacter endophyticus TaxID=1522174 RepID=UPI003AF0D623
MISAPRESLLTALPAGFKFAALLIISIALYLIASLPVLGAAVFISLGLLVMARPRWKLIRLPLITLALILSVVFATLAWQSGWQLAAISVMRLVSMCLIAYAVTLSTTFDEMLTVFQTVSSPLRYLGANPEQIALTLSMTLRFVPELHRVYREVREAQYARGLANNPFAISVPLVIRSLRMADDVAESLDARGYDSQESSPRNRK